MSLGSAFLRLAMESRYRFPPTNLGWCFDVTTKPCPFMRKAFYPRALYAIALIALGVFVAVVSGWLIAWLGSGFGGTSIGRSTGSTVVLADAINPGEGILSLDPDKVLARFD